MHWQVVNTLHDKMGNPNLVEQYPTAGQKIQIGGGAHRPAHVGHIASSFCEVRSVRSEDSGVTQIVSKEKQSSSACHMPSLIYGTRYNGVPRCSHDLAGGCLSIWSQSQLGDQIFFEETWMLCE